MLSRRDAKQLRRLLADARAAVVEYSADQSYRADAMRTIREKLMEMYHRHRVEDARELLDRIAAVEQLLDARLADTARPRKRA